MIILYTDLFLPEESNAIVIFELKASPSPIQGHALFTVGISSQKLTFPKIHHMRHKYTLQLQYPDEFLPEKSNAIVILSLNHNKALYRATPFLSWEFWAKIEIFRLSTYETWFCSKLTYFCPLYRMHCLF